MMRPAWSANGCRRKAKLAKKDGQPLNPCDWKPPNAILSEAVKCTIVLFPACHQPAKRHRAFLMESVCFFTITDVISEVDNYSK